MVKFLNNNKHKEKKYCVEIYFGKKIVSWIRIHSYRIQISLRILIRFQMKWILSTGVLRENALSVSG